jgi:hypothetical protein
MIKFIIFLFAIFILQNHSNAQSGWVRDPKDFFIKPDYTFYKSNQFYTINKEPQTTTTFSQKTYSLYGEYGLSNSLAVHAYIPVLKINGYANTATKSGIGDVKLELKYAIDKSSFPVAISFAPEFPTGKKDLYAKLTNNPLDSLNLATGDGEFNLWTTFAASHSFYPKPYYASAFIAYNWRAKLSSQLQAGVEAGYKFKNKIWLISKLSILNSVGAKTVGDFITNDGTNNTTFILTSVYEIGKHLGIGFQFQQYNSLITKLRNSYKADVFSLYLTINKKQ